MPCLQPQGGQPAVSFRTGGLVPTPQDGPNSPIDLNNDASQLSVLQGIQSILGPDSLIHPEQTPVFEAFANSPPWWMTPGPVQCSIGIPTVDGLAPGTYQQYANYLVKVLEAFHQLPTHIDFATVEPFNEPHASFSWPTCGRTHCQEGANFQPSTQDLILAGFPNAFAVNGPDLATQVSAMDGNTPDETWNDFQAYTPLLGKDVVSQLNTHTYDDGTPNLENRANLMSIVHSTDPTVLKRLWVSEFGNGGTPDDSNSGFKLAQQIAIDFKTLRPEAWVYWQAVENVNGPDNFGLMAVDSLSTGNNLVNTHRYTALAHYSRFIRPGYWILSTNDLNQAGGSSFTIAAMSPDRTRIVLVTTDCQLTASGCSTALPLFRSVQYNLQDLGVTDGTVRAWRSLETTSPDVPLNYIGNGGATLSNGILTDNFQTNGSITTYVIDLPTPLLPPTGAPPGGGSPLTVSAGPDVTGNETQPITLNGSVSGGSGPTPQVTWQATPVSGTDPNASCTFSDPHSPVTSITCSDEGDYRAMITADNGVDAPVSSFAAVHSLNLGPALSITAPAPWQTYPAPATVNLVAPITDPGAHDTHTCTINWDDGSPPEVFAQEGSCDRSHTYTTPGIYTINVTVTDDDQHQASQNVIAIVFDPTAGFVTGGGWIDSPPGAFTADPTLSGKAHFAIEASYKGSALKGDVKFWLPDGTRLDTTNMDWLVVNASAGEVAIKGSGSFNGQAVRFIFYGYHGCGSGSGSGCQPGPDRMRMVIWSASAGSLPQAGQLLYDNVAGADFELADANPQPLGGGSIQIHS